MPQECSPLAVLGGTQELVAVVGDAYRVLARSEDTGGVYAMIEAYIPPNAAGPPPHTHTREEEAFYVIQGELTVTLDGRDALAPAGSYMDLPRGIPHKFRNDSSAPVRMLVIVRPGGFEKFFHEVGKPIKDLSELGPPAPEEIQRVLATAPRYGVQLHGL